jgi:hypothetical protein
MMVLMDPQGRMLRRQIVENKINTMHVRLNLQTYLFGDETSHEHESTIMLLGLIWHSSFIISAQIGQQTKVAIGISMVSPH